MKATSCEVPTCPSARAARGYCFTHLARLKKWGDVRADIPIRSNRLRPKSTTCSIDTCDEPVYCRGWCKAHYYRNHYTGDVRADEPIWEQYAQRGLPCAEDGCPDVGVARGMCDLHYSRWQAKQVAADPKRREAKRAYHRAFKRAEFARDPDLVRERARRWRRDNPAKFRETRARYRLRLNQARHIPFTDEQLRAKVAYWGDRCWMCHGPHDAIDHVKPLSKGGWHALMNARPTCKSCNSSKNGRWPYPVTGHPSQRIAA